MAVPKTESIALEGAPCPVRWQRLARARQVSLRIDPRAGAVVVTLPPRVRRAKGLALLASHAGWVRQRLAALGPAQALEPGTVLPLGGVARVIRLDPAGPAGVRLGPGAILVGGAVPVAVQVAGFLRAEAARQIAPRVVAHAARLGVVPRAVRLKDLRSRWGSCAADGTLVFAWRLVLAPDWVLDYAVAHEVTHLREMNHGPRFWALLAGLSPLRAPAVAWLKQHGPGLLRVG